jgi:hypothetical protein
LQSDGIADEKKREMERLVKEELVMWDAASSAPQSGAI